MSASLVKPGQPPTYLADVADNDILEPAREVFVQVHKILALGIVTDCTTDIVALLKEGSGNMPASVRPDDCHRLVTSTHAAMYPEAPVTKTLAPAGNTLLMVIFAADGCLLRVWIHGPASR